MAVLRRNPFLVIVLVATSQAFGASKELVALQAQVQGLQDRLSGLQRATDENIGIMTNLMERNAEKVRGLEHNLQLMQSQLGKDRSLRAQQIEKITSQVNALSAAALELKNRFEAPPSPREPHQDTGVPVPAQIPLSQSKPPTQDAVRTQPPQQQIPAALDGNLQQPTAGNLELYQSAIQHYEAKDFEAAADEFTRYLKTDRQSEVAITAQYLLAEAEYQQQDFEGALEDYTAVVTRLSDPAKAATARYKKALSLLELGRNEEAILEFQNVIQRYPRSVEASRAAKKLRGLGLKGGHIP